MDINNFIFSQKVIGQERKAIAVVVAAAMNVGVEYEGVPTFAYAAGGWRIGKDNVLKSPETKFCDAKTLRPVIDALKKAEFAAEGSALVAFSKEGHTEASIENISNLLKSKGNLLKKALDNVGDILVIETDIEITFAFCVEAFNADDLLTCITLVWRLSEQAKVQKHATSREKPTDNEKYTLRCFILRLGFIGDEFKTERKVLLSRLEGNCSWKKPVEVM